VQRALSTGITPLFKFVVPVIAAFCGLALAFSVLEEGWGSAVFVLLLTAFLVFWSSQFFAPLKRVVALEHKLWVSNYRTAIEVPYFEIESVSRVLRRWDIVQVVFRNDTPFGKAILFMAPQRFFWLGEPPAVAFLRHRAAEAGG
jgi:hypothetical protein